MKRHPSALISRRNYKDTRAYLTYCAEVRQLKPRSVQLYRIALDKLLAWSTDITLPNAPRIRPVLPTYLAELEPKLSHTYRKKTLTITRAFFTWVVERYPDRYHRIKRDWIESLRPEKYAGSVKKRELYTIEEIRQLLNIPANTITEQRTQAAVALLFLSGMRIGAFTTMPKHALDLSHSPPRVLQWPELGVKTKNSKAANTYLLTAPELDNLHALIRSWHTQLPEGAMWYALLEPGGGFSEIQEPGKYRKENFTRYLKRLCERAQVEYKSAHKIRHGHAVYALKHCQTMADFKAVSQNLMHSSLSTTDRIYSNLVEDDVATRIASLGNSGSDSQRIQALAEELFKLAGRTV